jgi:tetratricopeptide (TPR) repeat protein
MFLRLHAAAGALIALLLMPSLSIAQGTVDFNGTGGAAASSATARQGGWGTPRGFKESTATVTGMPLAAYDPAIEYSNGLTDLEFGCFMQAREDFRHSLSVQPKNPRAWFLLGVAYNSSGDRAAAAGAYSKALDVEPDMIDAERELAVSAALQGQADKAQTILASLKTAAVDCGGGCADADLLKASMTRVEAALSGQLTEAMRPESPPAVCTTSTTKAARDCFAAAKFGDPHGDGADVCTTAIASTLPEALRTKLLVNRGVVHLSHTRARPAIEDFDKAIAMNGQIGDAYTNRGAAHLLMKQFDQARADIDRGLALGSGEPQRAYYNRGMADNHLGDNKAAYFDFMRAATLDPNWTAPKLELARFKVGGP